MNLTPDEREQILADYAESCRLRFIESPGECTAIMAINQPDVWNKNCRDDVIKAIRDGRDTWERIADVAARFNATTPEDWRFSLEMRHRSASVRQT